MDGFEYVAEPGSSNSFQKCEAYLLELTPEHAVVHIGLE